MFPYLTPSQHSASVPAAAAPPRIPISVDRSMTITITGAAGFLGQRMMRLLGVSSLAELEPRHVTQLTRLVPVGSGAASVPLEA